MTCAADELLTLFRLLQEMAGVRVTLAVWKAWLRWPLQMLTIQELQVLALLQNAMTEATGPR